MQAWAQRVIDAIDNAAAKPDDSPDIRLSKTVLIFVSTFAVLGVPFEAIYCHRLGQGAAATIAAAYAAMSAAFFVHLLFSKNAGPATWFQLTALLAVPAGLQWTAGGFVGSGGVVLWGIISPLCALIFRGADGAIPWYAAYLLIVVFAGVPDLIAPGAASADTSRTMLFTENFAIVASILFFAMRFFIREREKARAALQLEQQKSERLLLNILPRPIADRLKTEGGVIADAFSEATILFADIVGFTAMSAKLKPEELLVRLNRLFSTFDELAEKHGVEKIKTIGDAYMVCAGLPEPAADHAERAAAMALSMLQAIERLNREFGTTLQMRIGINSGPVVAGVIGLKKFIYDLWGDAVNTASRMESTGAAGQIQCSEATYLLLKKRYRFQDRGEIQVKGLGSMHTYLLLGQR